jgi:hypothetical protein
VVDVVVGVGARVEVVVAPGASVDEAVEPAEVTPVVTVVVVAAPAPEAGPQATSENRASATMVTGSRPARRIDQGLGMVVGLVGMVMGSSFGWRRNGWTVLTV